MGEFGLPRNHVKPDFHMIVMIVAIAENGCDDPDDHKETSIFFSVTIVTIRIATIVEFDFDDRGDQVTIENLMETTSAAIVTVEMINCSLQCISFLDFDHSQNGIFRISNKSTTWCHQRCPHKFLFKSTTVCMI